MAYWGDTIPLRPYLQEALLAAKPNSGGFIDQALQNAPTAKPEGNAPGWLKDAVQSAKA